MKKIAAIIVTVVIAFVWVVTVVGIGPAGPIQDKIKLGLDISGGVYVVLEAQTAATGSELQGLMEQTQAVIDQRVNEMGLAEPVITIEGDKRIRVELPGVDDPEQAIQTIGTTAQLSFKLADGTVALEGNEVSGSTVQQDSEHGGYLITLEFTPEGGQDFYDATAKAYNREVAEPFFSTEITSANQIAIVLDDEILSAPSVDNGAISGGSAVITRSGGFDQEYAIQVSTLIRAGALPVELAEVESSAIGATLGIEALQNSLIGGLIGILLVFVLMIAMYRFMGVGATLALLLYIPLIPWIIVGLGGVLTLPGIAGVILSIGMAVDANVIIFSRIKDEVAEGKTIRVSVNTGFRKAIATILDAQITTLIAGVVLYQLGTGPVKGFALTLVIGILVSLFTALAITNIYVRTFSESLFLVKHGLLGMREGGGVQGTRLSRRFNFMKNRKVFYIVTAVILVVGIGLGVGRGFNLGIDFTGGTMMQIDLGRTVATEEVRDTLAKNGITDADIVSAGASNESVIVKTTQALTSADREAIMASFAEDYDGVTEESLQTFEQFGPSVGKMLTDNAIRAVLIAIALMLVYIIIRFRLRLGIAAIITTFHDVAIMVAMYGLFQLTINNPFIAAILTVVGYSINDTIVIFDRIRENLGGMRRQPLDTIIDTSVNQTLVRSIMTSLTTIVAIMALIFLGGDSIRQFAIPLVIGIITGTLSSIFIASPIFYDFAKGTHRGGMGKYKGLEKGEKPIAKTGEEMAAEATGTGKKKKSKSKRKPDGNGAVV
ncbi:MAG: protein translocase subunit SecD [Clostridiales Family XIII bacterium]|jgi:SecD/SecF fusion protein|nr:protein translocase subunit SecD [Clostridiales Family XIII bacterium]